MKLKGYSVFKFMFSLAVCLSWIKLLNIVMPKKMHLANTYIEYLLGWCLYFMDVIKQATNAWEGNDAWLLSYRTDIWELCAM